MDSTQIYSTPEALRDLNGPLRDVEKPCSRTEEILLECQHFNPIHGMNILFRSGFNRSDLDELESLLRLLICETNEQLEPGEREKLPDLKNKYCVLDTGAEARSNYLSNPVQQYVTFERLRTMFPHMAMAEKIKSIEPKIESVNSNPKLHAVFYLPEFGGLVPTEKVLKKESREALLILHLFAMERLKDLPIPLYTRHVVLKKHLESSMLSDERRMIQLIRLGLIYGGGDLMPEIQTAFDEIIEREPIFQKHVNFKALT